MIDVTIEQIRAAQEHDFTALGNLNAEMEPRICQLARKVARSNNREMIEDLEQDGRLAMLECLEKFDGSTVAEFFKYVNGSIQGTMTNSRKKMGRSEVSRNAAAIFESAVKLAADQYAPAGSTTESVISLAEEIVQDPDIMGGPYKILSAELAYAARLSYEGNDGIESFATDGGEYATTGMKTYEMDYDAVAEAADAANEGGRPVTWISAARVLERSLVTPKDKESSAHLLDALANAYSNTHTALDMEIFADSRTDHTSHDVHNAFAMLSSLARYDVPAAEPNTVTEEARRLAGVKLSKVREAMASVAPTSAAIVQTVSEMSDDARTGKNMTEVATSLGLHPDSAKSVYASAVQEVRAAYTGETLGVASGRECTVCHVSRPLDDFYVTNKKTGTRKRQCKDCVKAKGARNNGNKSKEAKAEENRRYREKMKQKYA